MSPRDALEAAYRTEARRVRATLIRLLGHFDAAEEALHDAFAAAAVQWPRDGVPANPYAWLVSTGRFRTIDRWRRQARLDATLDEVALQDAGLERQGPDDLLSAGPIADDELRLIFMCCHPALPADARVALTLREVAGLTTEEIARAFLVPTPTIAQRIVRAKAKIRDDALPYELPSRADLPARAQAVLRVVYLVFNEGYVATAGPSLVRDELCAEALRLARLVATLLDDAEAWGLVALMLLHDARRATRVDAAGDLVLLEDQDRSSWDAACVAEAQALIVRALGMGPAGPYRLQAAIAALHVEAPSVTETDWAQIVVLYDALLLLEPSPVVALNRAVALAMRDGPEEGLAQVEAVMSRGGLDDYALAHAARADLHRRLGQVEQARAAYQRALELTAQPAEQRFLRARLRALTPGPAPS